MNSKAQSLRGKNQSDREDESMNKKVIREVLDTVLYIGFILALTWFIIAFVGQRTRVDGSSMEATLSNGDNLIVEKISYRFKDPQRFDIIVFPPKYEKKGIYYIKRIIGLPGETVQIDADGTIYINGQRLEESYGREVIRDPGLAAEPITLEEDEYFVMGDNRNNSTDSRFTTVGNIHKKDIIGRAWVRIWPLDKFGVLKHR